MVDQFVETLFRYGIDAHVPETRALWQRAIDQLAPWSGEASHPTWGRLLSRAVFLLGQRGSGAEVWGAALRSGVEKSLEIARNHGNIAEIGYSLGALGMLLLLQGDVAGAMHYYEESVIHYQQINDRFSLGESLHWKGLCHSLLGQKEDSVRCIQQSRDAAREAGNKFEEGWALFVLGTFYASEGHTHEVEQFMQESRKILRMFGNPPGLSRCDVYLGLFALLRGNFVEAERCAETALELATDCNTYADQRDALTLHGAILCLQENYAQGKQLIDQAAALVIPRLEHLQYLLAWAPSLANCGLQHYEAAQQNADSLFQWGTMTRTMLAPVLATPLIRPLFRPTLTYAAAQR
jgi:tetratricopeptide (TPR) repeat protein